MSSARHIAHAALGGVSILAIGIVAGIHLDRAILRPAPIAVEHDPASPAPNAPHEDYVHQMEVDLGFSHEQASQVQEIMNRHQEAVNEAWAAVHLRLQAAIDSVTVEIEGILNPEEREALHEWLTARHSGANLHSVGAGH